MIEEYVTLAECPPGLFIFNGHFGEPHLGFKSEYGNEDVFCAESGERFWGGATTKKQRAGLLVRPIEAEKLLAAHPLAKTETPIIGGKCSKCGHVHTSIVCTCGCDISGELFRTKPNTEKPAQAGGERITGRDVALARQIYEYSKINGWGEGIELMLVAHRAVGQRDMAEKAAHHVPTNWHHATGYRIECQCGAKFPYVGDEDEGYRAWSEHIRSLAPNGAKPEAGPALR